MRPLRVAIDARLVPGTSGGVENVVVGLAQGLAQVGAPDVSVTFLTLAGQEAWLTPHLGSSMEVRQVAPSSSLPSRVARRLRSSWRQPPSVDRPMDRLGADVVHFPFQSAGLVAAPFIYHPHDLQHRHLPHLFTAQALAAREAQYPALCRAAAAIAVGSSWVKDDLVAQLAVPREKVHVIPLAPVLAEEECQPLPDITSLGLPATYAVFPAATWRHKNHGRLLAALARLRSQGVEVPLVLTGPRVPEGVELASLARDAGVADLVTDLGYLPLSVAHSVVAGATVMVVPTLFEAASFPIWEAFLLGVPVACSDVTSLPRQVGDAALVFDPTDTTSIAQTLRSLWESPDLRTELTVRGRARVAEFTWENTARSFVALYRLLGGRELSGEDMDLLTREPPL